ncbi:MAG: hypothetical protein ACLFP4_16755 [Spirochaetales bacterium]
MALREKPKTMKETIDALWYTIVGTNGEGMGERVARVERKLDEHLGDHGVGKRKPRRLEVLTTVLAVAIGLQSLGLLDGIRAVIWQALTGRPVVTPPSVERTLTEDQQREDER